MNNIILLPTKRTAIKNDRFPLPKVLKLLDQYKCQHCGTKKHLTKDHIIPLTKGGLDSIANYQILCYSCNQEKSDNINTDYVIGVNVKELRGLFIDSFYSQVTKRYCKAVFDSCITLDNFQLNHTDIDNIHKVVDLAKVYGLHNTYPFLRDSKYLMKRYIPKQHKFVVEFDPKFNVSKEALISYFNRRG